MEDEARSQPAARPPLPRADPCPPPRRRTAARRARATRPAARPQTPSPRAHAPRSCPRRATWRATAAGKRGRKTRLCAWRRIRLHATHSPPGAPRQELEAMKARLKEMEDEAAKLRAMQARRLAGLRGGREGLPRASPADAPPRRGRRPRWRRRWAPCPPRTQRGRRRTRAPCSLATCAVGADHGAARMRRGPSSSSHAPGSSSPSPPPVGIRWTTL